MECEVNSSAIGVTEPLLRTVFAAVFEIDPESVSDVSSPDTVEKWDSFGHMRLVMTVEERFGVTLDMDQVLEIDSFGTLLHMLVDGAQAA